MNIPERFKIVPVLASDNINAGVDTNSINMKNFHKASFIFTFGTLAGASGAVLKVFSGAADGAKTSALTFRYALGSATIGSASCDVLGAQSTSVALTLTAATYLDKMLIVEIDSAEMDVANGENWLTAELGAEADSGAADCVTILEPRYTQNLSATALA